MEQNCCMNLLKLKLEHINSGLPSSLGHKRNVINTGQVMNWDIKTACLYLSSGHTRYTSGSLSARLDWTQSCKIDQNEAK